MKEKNIDSKLDTKKVRLWFYISGAFFVLSIILTIFIFYFSRLSDNKKDNQQIVENKIENYETSLYPRLIDGVMVEEKYINPPVVGVMIDNHVDARPQSGIEKANLVFEAEVEGGITRFLSFFTVDQDIEEIGPVRSARPYFVNWAKEFSALYVHVGGSPAALVKLSKDNIFHINEFYNESCFWRGENKFAPHNVFTSSNLLKDYINRNEKKRNDFKTWKFVDEKNINERKDFHEIIILFKTYSYEVKWKYDKENNYYIRFMAEKPHQTESNEIVTAKNVVIMILDSEEIDEKLRLEMDNIGNGKAVVCSEGNCKNGIWEKTDSESRTMFFYEDGSEIEFVRGNTWVEIVKPEYKIEF